MPFDLHPPSAPVFQNPSAFYLGMIAGFGVVIVATIVTDKLGTYLFHKGYAKPFYMNGRRIHHVWIYVIAPAAYLLISGLLLLGYILPIWTEMYLRLASVFVVVGICMCVDFVGDKRLQTIRKDILHHHEWIYALILLYIAQFVVEIRI
jgi:hypothetical protein